MRLPIPVLLLAITCLGGCQTARDMEQKAAASETGLEARLGPLGFNSGVGTIRFADRRDGFAMLIAIWNLPLGPYRVALHETGNCSSPNGFSAGAPWAPPGAPRAAGDLVPILWVRDNAMSDMTVTIAASGMFGERGLIGRSVVVHDGMTVDGDVKPGGPSRRILCGVIGPPQSMIFK